MKLEFIEYLKQHIGQHVEGQTSGFTQWLNGKIKSVSDEGDIEMEFEVRENMLNPFGVMHGGALAAILDEVLGMQLYVKSDEDAAYLSLGMNVDFVKAAKPTDTIIAKPHVIRIGRKTANVTCELRNQDGVVLAHASSNFLRML